MTLDEAMGALPVAEVRRPAKRERPYTYRPPYLSALLSGRMADHAARCWGCGRVIRMGEGYWYRIGDRTPLCTGCFDEIRVDGRGRIGGRPEPDDAKGDDALAWLDDDALAAGLAEGIPEETN